MGNNASFPSLENINKSKNLTLAEFQAQLTRKMTIHLLSSKIKDCIDFIKFFTKEKIENSKELLEENIKKKINLYSYMNYKIYENVDELMEVIEAIANNAFQNPKSFTFSEVLIILDNDEINIQIDTIRDKFKNNKNIKKNSHLKPFLMIISPKTIKLNDFLNSKTFQYKFTLEDFFNFLKEEKEEKNQEISDFIRKLNLLFCFYNELGDEFSFINSDNEEIFINIEDNKNITNFINILLLGKTGTGKSTLINLLLEEMKSLEGGNGFSTTSKNIIVYTKKDFPIRFYDVKGIENEKTVENYLKIMKDLNYNNSITHDSINVIFYFIEYKINGTIIEEMDYKLFEELIKFNIPIIFIITKTNHDPEKKSDDEDVNDDRKNKRDIIKNSIKSLILKSFEKNNLDGQNFFDNFTKIFFVNLVKILDPYVPVFGIDKFLSHLSELVPKEDWEALESACNEKNEIKCKKLLKKNIFLRYYSELENLNKRNHEEAEQFLKALKAGSFFSGMLPGIDIGMEYLYKYLFKEKLKSLYNFDYEEAKKVLNIEKEKKDKTDNTFDAKKNSINNSRIDDEDSNLIDDNDIDSKTLNKEKEEKKESKNDEEIKNGLKNTTSIIRGVGEAAGIVIKALPEAGEITLESGAIVARTGISAGLKIGSWILLPITCITFGILSIAKVHQDCQKILNTFEKVFIHKRFETLLGYINSVKSAIDNLKDLGQKIINNNKKK